MPYIAIHISGMSCGHCLNAVSQAIREVPGVEVKSVRIGRAEVTVLDGDATAQVRAAIENAGYRVEGVSGG
jgi:copper chaperone CopZ